MGTIIALLLLFGGLNAAAVAVKSFVKGMREGRAAAAARPQREARSPRQEETPERRERLERWRGN